MNGHGDMQVAHSGSALQLPVTASGNTSRAQAGERSTIS